MGEMRIGNYQTLGELGRGAHSTILHIRRREDSKPYALKVVTIDTKEDQKFLEQARHEFRVAGMLDHPNLLKIYVLETQTNWMFRVRKVHLLLEYVNGKTLDTFGKLPLPALVQVFVQVAAGLVHLHRKNVCHGDLKPNNIILGRNGAVKVIDYGLAWIKGQPKSRVQGTPEYIAPETATHKIVNERSDIYNFGATMYRMVTKKLPPSVLSNEGRLLPIKPADWPKLIQPIPELNPKAPPTLCELILRCIAFDPSDRPQRASEIQGALDHLADELVRSPADSLEALEW